MSLSFPEGLSSLRDWIRWGASRFNEAGLHFGHGTDNALDEALALVLHALHLDHSLDPAYLDARLTPAEQQAVFELLKKRVATRMPAAYLTGRAWFAGLEFEVTPAVLVPRSPIAELIEANFEPWLENQENPRILDLCTGSGCIAIACAHHLPGARVDASDISAEALAAARRNLERHGLEDVVQLHQADLFDGLPPARYDLIVSNPPYVGRAELESLPEEYHHEPRLGLAAGEEGLDLVLRILAQGADWLAPGGIMVVEVGNSMETLAAKLPEVPFLWLDFQRGGHGVFLLTAEQLEQYRPQFLQECEQ